MSRARVVMAERGRGVVQYLAHDESPREVVETFYERFRHPVLTDISIDFGHLQVTDLIPGRLPDVFAGSPVQVTGRYRQGGRARATIHGRIGTRRVEIPFDLHLPAAAHDRRAIAHLWARRKIEQIEAQYARNIQAARHEILPLALEFGLTSRFTSFVAIEDRISADANEPIHTVGVPVALPAGMSDEGVQGHLVGGQVSAAAAPAEASAARRRPRPAPRPTKAASAPSRGRSRDLDALLDGSLGGGAAPAATSSSSSPSQRRLSRTQIMQTIRRHRSQLRRCHQQRLRQNPELSGVVIVRLVIGANGQVTQVTVQRSTLSDRPTEQCLLRQLRRLRFPARPSGAPPLTVNYPFRFSP